VTPRRIATRLGRPAHELFAGRITASLIREHGSYEAAKTALEPVASSAPPRAETVPPTSPRRRGRRGVKGAA
jgi:hypothetical protein